MPLTKKIGQKPILVVGELMLSRIGERTITHKNKIEVKFEAKLLLKKSPDSTISISELKHAE